MSDAVERKLEELRREAEALARGESEMVFGGELGRLMISGVPCPGCGESETAEVIELPNLLRLRLFCEECAHCWWVEL